VFAKAGAVTKNVLAIAKPTNLLHKEALQSVHALDERQLRSTLAIQKQKIEGEEDEFTCPAFIHRSLKAAECGHTVTAERAKLAVEIGRLHRQRA
jgi:hypothetical protein